MKRYLISAAAAAMAAMLLSTAVWADASQSRYFVDMNENSYGFWAIDEVDSLYSKGVVRGVGENRFAPEKLMERGDFVLMLENAFHFPTIQVNKYNFYDVADDDYYFTAINNARGNGIVEDTPIFNPENPIKRVDAFKMLYNTMNMYGCVGSNGSTDVSMYSDGYLLLNTKDKIAAATLTNLGIITGSNGELKPNDTVTRAEMAIMLSKAIEVYEANGSKEANTGTTQSLKPVLSGAEANPDPDRVNNTKEKITETYSVSDGESAEIEDAEVVVSSGDGVTAQGSGTSLSIIDTKLTTSSKGSKVISVTDGAEAELDGIDINASANESIGIYVGEDSEVSLESSKVFSRYAGGRAVESKGILKVDDSTLQAAKEEAVKLYGGTKTDITSSDIITEGTKSGIVIVNNGDAYDKAVINLTDVTFKGGNKAAAILVENAKVVINFKDVELEGIKKLLDTRYDYSKGIRDTEVELNLDGQKLEGEINGDDRSIVTLKLTNGSNFKGVLNYTDTAKEMNLEIDGTSLLELTDDCYIDALIVTDERMRTDRDFSSIIDDNGATIYYDSDNHENDYLNEGTYALQNGGVITPANKD